MAAINLNLPDATAARVVHALCFSAGLPESPANAKKVVTDWVKGIVAMVERGEAEQSRGPVPTPDVASVVG